MGCGGTLLHSLHLLGASFFPVKTLMHFEECLQRSVSTSVHFSKCAPCPQNIANAHLDWPRFVASSQLTQCCDIHSTIALPT